MSGIASSDLLAMELVVAKLRESWSIVLRAKRRKRSHRTVVVGSGNGEVVRAT